jgi:hypothetical protein
MSREGGAHCCWSGVATMPLGLMAWVVNST